VCPAVCFSQYTLVSTLFTLTLTLNNITMGKGDKKSKKGKMFMGSNGKSRPKNHVPAYKPTGKATVKETKE